VSRARTLCTAQEIVNATQVVQRVGEVTGNQYVTEQFWMEDDRDSQQDEHEAPLVDLAARE
jgi:hypothetical protein